MSISRLPVLGNNLLLPTVVHDDENEDRMTNLAAVGRDFDDKMFESLVEAVGGRRLAILTGAGVSTDSGIPDYRGEGSPKRTPMTFQEFVANSRSRQRYWAGSHQGWRRFGTLTPNGGHRALAQMERSGITTGIVTQNVDGLHSRAGSLRVVPLHGAMDRVVCLDCEQVFARDNIAARIDDDNPQISNAVASETNPDGDAEVTKFDEFIIPTCSVCGGMLKPDVVFFGEFVPVDRFAAAACLVRSSGALLVAGSSLAVNSGVRLFELARRLHQPIVIINRGVTWGDSRAEVKLEAGTSEALIALAARLIEPEGNDQRAAGERTRV